eukprot:7939343-Alexandrium_andersonii.AAC.1
MSASLVGSEMCIRDRIPPGRSLLPGASQCTTPDDHDEPRGRGADARGACLLYTSDAADDM